MNQDESIRELEQALGLPKGFCFKLIEEDDWSFVIKLQALLESAVSDLITHSLQRSELTRIFSLLAMSSEDTGKIAFVKALNLLPNGHIEFIKALSKIRNTVAHSIRNVDFDLVAHFKNTPPKKLKQLTDLWAFGFSVAGEEHHHEPLARWIMTINMKRPLPNGVSVRSLFLMQHPKKVILWSALNILDAISMCNWGGPQMWNFLMHMHHDDRKECEDWVHDVFGKAKVGDPKLPERIAQKFERLNPGVRIKRDTDGQPELKSLAAAWVVERKRLMKEWAEEE